jgi:hypothetical protein
LIQKIDRDLNQEEGKAQLATDVELAEGCVGKKGKTLKELEADGEKNYLGLEDLKNPRKYANLEME